MKQSLVFGFLGFFMVAGMLLFVPIPSNATLPSKLDCSYPCGTQASPTNVQAPVSLGVVQNTDIKLYFFVVKGVSAQLQGFKEESGWISSNSYTTKNIKETGVYEWYAAATDVSNISSISSTNQVSTDKFYFKATKVCPAGSVCIQNPLESASFTDVVDKILNILFFVAIAVAPVMILVAGFKFLTGGGDPKNLTAARQMLVWTGVGFGIILISKGIVMILRNVIGF